MSEAESSPGGEKATRRLANRVSARSKPSSKAAASDIDMEDASDGGALTSISDSEDASDEHSDKENQPAAAVDR